MAIWWTSFGPFRASPERRPSTSFSSDGASFIESDEVAMPGAFATPPPTTPSSAIYYPDLTLSLQSQRTESWVIAELPGDEESRVWGNANDDIIPPLDVFSLPSSSGSERTPSPTIANSQEHLSPPETDGLDSDGPADNEVKTGPTILGVSNETTGAADSDREYDDDPDGLAAVLQALDMSAIDTVVDEYPLKKLPFWAQYEATRFALHCGVGLSNTELSKALAPEIEQLKVACEARDLQRSWYIVMERIATRCSPLSPVSPQPRVSATLWSFLQKEEWGKTVCMTGSLEFNTTSDLTTFFTMKLNPLSYQASNRFWRKWGSDRYLTIRMPSCPAKPSPRMPFRKKAICHEPEIFNKSLVNFLENDGIELLGRIWKLFFVFDGRDKKGNQAVLFAVRGEGIEIEQECEVEDLLNWHIPLVPKNLNSTVPKLWSRVSLGFTKTIPSIHFTPDQISPSPGRKSGETYTPDKADYSKSDQVMNDGCCIASPAVFREIQKLLGLKEAPTAVQGRIGPAKGLWFVCPVALREIFEGKRDPDELWIRINDSQYKYQTHQELHLDPAWTTLDLHSWSHSPKPATVNLQLLEILEHRGVPFEPLRDFVSDHLDAVFQDLRSVMNDPVRLRDWIYENGKLSDSRTKDAVAYQGACPVSPAEKLVMLIDGGFSPQTHPYLMKEQKKIMEGFWKTFKEKMKIPIPFSTHLFCIADLTGTLKEGEVSLQFSKGMEDPRTGRRRDVVEGDILVARNPALLPSDIQKVRAVQNEYLRELTDVIVFSIQGSRSLASLLSGGDYDGDKVWICWDQGIVKPFRKACLTLTELEDKEKETWFDSYQEKVNELKLEPLAPSTPQGSKLTVGQRQVARAFIRAGALYTLNSDSNLLGMYAKTHLRFSRTFGLDHPMSIELALLCGSLVDAPKQGLILKPTHTAVKNRKFNQYGYKDDRSDPEAADPEDTNATIIARLDGFAQIKIAKMKADFEKDLPTPPRNDPDITDFARKKSAKARSDQELANCLKYLGDQLKSIQDKWNQGVHTLNQRDLNSVSTSGGLWHYSSSQFTEVDRFSNKVETLYAEYSNIKPIAATTHPIISDWIEDADKPNSEWQLLKASRAFSDWGGGGALVWYMAGQQLCQLKAMATGTYRCVQESVHVSLRADKRFLRHRREQKDLEWGIEEQDNDEQDLDA